MKVPEREIDDAAAQEKRQHRLAQDFQHDTKGCSMSGTRKLVITLVFEPGLCIVLGKARPRRRTHASPLLGGRKSDRRSAFLFHR